MSEWERLIDPEVRGKAPQRICRSGETIPERNPLKSRKNEKTKKQGVFMDTPCFLYVAVYEILFDIFCAYLIVILLSAAAYCDRSPPSLSIYSIST